MSAADLPADAATSVPSRDVAAAQEGVREVVAAAATGRAGHRWMVPLAAAAAVAAAACAPVVWPLLAGGAAVGSAALAGAFTQVGGVGGGLLADAASRAWDRLQRRKESSTRKDDFREALAVELEEALGSSSLIAAELRAEVAGILQAVDAVRVALTTTIDTTVRESGDQVRALLISGFQDLGTRFTEFGSLLEQVNDHVARLAETQAEIAAGTRAVLERLPPDSADRAQIAVYLEALIRWLNTDPWPTHRQFGGPALTPAAIERKLHVRDGGQGLDADELAARCRRLVILGGPGSGKSWLAKRSARLCAEEALQALAAGSALNEIELPLFTTCSWLLATPGDIRQAAVSSALDHIGDLGNSMISAALRAFFAKRDGQVVLVIDSLDEGRGSDERLRQADTLPWRIVLTSRPRSWNGQLRIVAADHSHLVGNLEPLRYPHDVELFIRQWFVNQPEWGSELVLQIARRPSLQKAATVPLMLAFYCILGVGQPLPTFRRHVYTRVLKRMLTGYWRRDDGSRRDSDTCLSRLRAWAWSAAASHPVSGVGTWADEFPAEHSQLLREADNDALDHIATPLGPEDLDTGLTERRFIHRTIREHLVAEYVGSLPVDQAAEALLPHLWYDPDWEYAAPAALAMHDQRDELMLRLIRTANPDVDVHDVSVIDAQWEFRGFLARVAAESNEADWSPEMAMLIGTARIELATAGHIDHVEEAQSWPTSNRQVRARLLWLLVDRYDTWVSSPLAPAWQGSGLAATLATLDPTPEERRRAQEPLLRMLASTGHALGGSVC
jgi:hypothetical protein